MVAQSLDFLKQNPLFGCASGIATGVIVHIQLIFSITGLIGALSNLAVVFGCIASFATMIIQVRILLKKGIKGNGIKDNNTGSVN